MLSPLRAFETPKNRSYLALAVFLLSISIILGEINKFKCVEASVVPNIDYCYEFGVSVENSSASGLSYFDFPLRVAMPVDNWEWSEKIDKASSGEGVYRKAWDLNSYQGANTNQFDVVVQNLTTSGSNPVYAVQPFIQNGTTTKTNYNIGHNSAKRDQGIYFYSTTDTASIIDCHNKSTPCVTYPIDYTINFRINTDFKPLNSTLDYLTTSGITMPPNADKILTCSTYTANPCYVELVSKFNPSATTGYRIRLKRTDTAGVFSTSLVCQIDGDIVETPITTYVGKNSTNNIMYKAYLDLNGNTQLDCGYSTQGTTTEANVVSLTSGGAGHLLGATPNNTNISVCDNCEKTMLYDITFIGKTANSQDARYMFNANETNETDSAVPYTTQVDDSSGVYNEKLVWAISTTNSANDMSVSISEATAQATSQTPQAYSSSVSWMPSWYGGGNPIALSDPDRAQNSFLYWLYGKPSNWDVPDDFYYTMIFLSIGSIFGMMVYMMTREVFWSTLIIGSPLLFGVTQGLIPLWLGIIWLVTVIFVISGKQYFRGI